MKAKNTSWGGVADWYHGMMEGEGTFQKDVILPNLLRVLQIKKNEKILDLGCGTGFFSREFFRLGASVLGVDVGSELLKIAREHSDPKIMYMESSADRLDFILKESQDTIVVVLAIQNMEKVNDVFKECFRILKKGGRLILVLNHPAFRVPQHSSWGFDEENMVQYRRVDSYLSEARVKIEMHPGKDKTIQTLSFHRPLQYYFKMFSKNNFAVTKMEEWISNRVGPKGRKFLASERARKEIPLFLLLEARK